MRANQKRYYQNRRSTHIFKVGYLFLLRKLDVDKMELKWEPNYRIVRLPSAWSPVDQNQFSGKIKDATLVTSNLKHPSEYWELKPSSFGRAAKFVNHPDNLPDIDF